MPPNPAEKTEEGAESNKSNIEIIYSKPFLLPYPYQHLQFPLFGKFVVNSDDRHSTHSREDAIKHAVAGGMAGCITRVMTHPFDVVKIRFQMQAEPISTVGQRSKYKSFSQAIKLMLYEEGIPAFFRGHVSGQCYAITSTLFQFWAFEKIEMYLRSFSWSQQNRAARHFIAGSLSGSAAASIAMPFDVIRTRVAAKDPEKGANSMLKIVKEVLQTEGITGLFRGLTITAAQTAPLIGFNFVFYKLFNQLFDTYMHTDNKSRPAWVLFVNGGLAGVIAKTITYPFDLIKKRLQLKSFANQRTTFGKNRFCTTTFSCLHLIFKKEGISGFYKGMVPTLIKSGIQSAFLFCLYDIIKFFL